MAMIDLHEQTKAYSCGAACLRNGLLVLGNRKKERAVRHAARTNHKGTSEVSLKAAAEKFGYSLTEHAFLDKAKGNEAYRWLVGELKNHSPVLLCVDDFSHWVLAIGMLDSKVAIADPAVHDQRRTPFGLYTRGGLLKRWWIEDADHVEKSQFFAMSLHPESALARARADKAVVLTGNVLKTLLRDDDTDIYDAGSDLTRIFTRGRGVSQDSAQVMTSGEFLEKYEKDVLDAVGYWHDEADIKLLRPVYQTYKDVARALNYLVSATHEKKALVELTALFAGMVEMH